MEYARPLPRSLSMATRAFWALAVAFALAACGDDTVNPSNPEAGPSKDATTDGPGKDGGDGGHADAHADAHEDAEGDVHQNDGESGDGGGD
jgi:hypothetical protein